MQKVGITNVKNVQGSQGLHMGKGLQKEGYGTDINSTASQVFPSL